MTSSFQDQTSEQQAVRKKTSIWIVLTLCFILYFGGNVLTEIIIILMLQFFDNTTFANPLRILFLDVCQALFLFLPAIIFSRLRFRQNTISMLGFNRLPTGKQAGLSFIMLLLLFPITSFLVEIQVLCYDLIGAKFFAEDFIRTYDMFMKVLITSGGFFYVVFASLSLSLTPAFCEETLFRGYVQTSLENNASMMKKILITGILFGLFHLNPVHTFGLITIGLFLSWTKEISHSMWLPITLHFLNNAIMTIIIITGINMKELETEIHAETFFSPVGFFIVILSSITFFLIGKYLTKEALAHN